MTHPMQPVVIDPHGVVRFRENRIVSMLLDHARTTGVDLNGIGVMVSKGQHSEDDLVQLMQLIGYSVCGAADLDFMPRDLIDAADAERERLTK
jgi:hypothetical protein